MHSKNVNFFIVKVLVKSNKGGWEVTLISFLLFLSLLSSIIQYFFLHLAAKLIKVMDNAGDWLYIVFLIVALVGSFFKPKKKQKQRPTVILGQPGKAIIETKHPSKPQKSFWETLEEIENGETRAVPQKKEESLPIKKNNQPSPFLPPDDEANHPLINNSNNLLTKQDKQENTIQSTLELDNAAALRKAVIYSEILNRKY